LVDTTQFQEFGSKLLDNIITGGIAIVGVLVLCGVIVAVALYIRYLRQFNVKVEILSLRGRGGKGAPIYKIVRDVGGFIERRKDKSRWFRLRGEKVDLPSPPLEALQLDSHGVNNLKILQKSDTEYYYLLPYSISTDTIIRGGKEVPITQMNLKIVEGDVAYWAQLRKRDDKKMFDVESLAMKLLPYVVPVLMFMLVIFLTYLITDHWGEFVAAADALREAAHALRDVSVAQTATGG